MSRGIRVLRSIPPMGSIPSRNRLSRRRSRSQRTGNVSRQRVRQRPSRSNVTNANRYSKNVYRIRSPREPICDVFDEESEFIIIGEFPGHNGSQITIETKDGLLAIGSRLVEFREEFTLPASTDPGSMKRVLVNGILQVRLEKS